MANVNDSKLDRASMRAQALEERRRGAGRQRATQDSRAPQRNAIPMPASTFVEALPEPVDQGTFARSLLPLGIAWGLYALPSVFGTDACSSEGSAFWLLGLFSLPVLLITPWVQFRRHHLALRLVLSLVYPVAACAGWVCVGLLTGLGRLCLHF